MSAREVIANELARIYGCAPKYYDRLDADAILAALRDAGLVVVPVEPTREMMKAMCARRGIDPSRNTVGMVDALAVNVLADSVADYRAMLAAAQEGER